MGVPDGFFPLCFFFSSPALALGDILRDPADDPRQQTGDQRTTSGSGTGQEGVELVAIHGNTAPDVRRFARSLPLNAGRAGRRAAGSMQTCGRCGMVSGQPSGRHRNRHGHDHRRCRRHAPMVCRSHPVLASRDGKSNRRQASLAAASGGFGRRDVIKRRPGPAGNFCRLCVVCRAHDVDDGHGPLPWLAWGAGPVASRRPIRDTLQTIGESREVPSHLLNRARVWRQHLGDMSLKLMEVRRGQPGWVLKLVLGDSEEMCSPCSFEVEQGQRPAFDPGS